MARRGNKGSRAELLHNALLALAEVCLVSLALGVAMGRGVTLLVTVLAGCLLGTVAGSVALLCRTAATSEEEAAQKAAEEAADALDDKSEDVPISEASSPSDAPRSEKPETPDEAVLLAQPELAETTEFAEAAAPQPAEAESVEKPQQAEALEPPAEPELAAPKHEALPAPAPQAGSEVDITPSVTNLDEWELGENPPSTLDLDALSSRIVGTADPITELKLLVGNIRTREAEGDDLPSPFERYAARLLTEAGLFSTDVSYPRMRIVRPRASNMFYLRIIDRTIPFLAKVRVLALEAALNALRFSDTYFDDPDAHSMEEHYQLLQKLTHSIAAQAPSLSEQVPLSDEECPDTEWAVRMAISTAFESFQLPHRLNCTWRVNVSDGNVAIQVELPPEGAFPSTRYVEDLGLVTASREMQHKAASDYALRLALLLANAAFRSSKLIKHVWVAGTVQSALRTACYLSVDFDRWRFSRLDLAHLGNLAEVYHSFAPTMRYEDGMLRPVEQSFSLDEWRFCPPRRYEPVELCSRKIAQPYAEELGCERVSGLSIDEAGKRELLAADIIAGLGDSTEQKVQLIMELAGDDPDPSVRSAAERTVTKLIEGSIEDDAASVGKEFLAGDALTRATEVAVQLLQAKKPEQAEALLVQVIDPLDQAGTYADSPYVEYRFFSNYVERALYNRLFAPEGRLPLLVPQAYYNAHYLLSMARLMQGRQEDALPNARRMVEIAPLDARSYIQLTRCLELCDRSDEAVETLIHLLEIGHDPQGLGVAYYRMAYFQWHAGRPLVAQCCYRFALHSMPSYTPLVAMELGVLAAQNPGSLRENLTDEEAEQVLRDAGIPIAPTSEMSEAFLACARASLNAEVFPVARNFAWVLGAFTHDDIMVGLLRSIEGDPSEQLEDLFQ